MKRPAATWETIYAHDRREHRHRCSCCSKIVNAGEPVVMAKVAAKTTRVLHAACADRVAMRAGDACDLTADISHRALMEMHANAHLDALGFRR